MKLYQILGRSCYGFGATLEVTRLLSFLEFVSISDRHIGHRSFQVNVRRRYSSMIRIM